jgi:hypothetical protein
MLVWFFHWNRNNLYFIITIAVLVQTSSAVNLIMSNIRQFSVTKLWIYELNTTHVWVVYWSKKFNQHSQTLFMNAFCILIFICFLIKVCKILTFFLSTPNLNSRITQNWILKSWDKVVFNSFLLNFHFEVESNIYFGLDILMIYRKHFFENLKNFKTIRIKKTKYWIENFKFLFSCLSRLHNNNIKHY